MRRLCLTFALLNFLAALIVYLVTGFGIGIREEVVFSKFRELEKHDLINQDALKRYNSGQFARQSAAGWLSEGESDWMGVAYVLMVLCVANGVAFIVLWRTFAPPRTGGFPVIRNPRTSEPPPPAPATRAQATPS
jgi:hypothetical protein